MSSPKKLKNTFEHCHNNMSFVLNLNDQDCEPSIVELGGKGASLVKLTKGGFTVPPGFIITSKVFDAFVMRESIQKEIEMDEEEVEKKCLGVCNAMDKEPISEDIQSVISERIEQISNSSSLIHPLFAVRSSGVSEDLDEASFAGMNDTILNVQGTKEAISDAVKKCWKSLFSKRAVLYRKKAGFPEYKTSIAVVVQVMIPSETSGVVFSVDPQTSSRSDVSLDGVQGMGEALVSGLVNADHWTIRKPYGKRGMEIVERRVGQQAFKLVSNYPNDGTTQVELSEEEGKKSCFTDKEVLDIATTACAIEKYYDKGMDIEFCYYQKTLFILQARPITHLLAIPNALNPLHNTENANWSLWLNFCYTQMLTEPFTPCGTSVYRFITGLSDKYLMSIHGFPYLNMASILKSKSMRLKMIKNITEQMDHEMGMIVQEAYQEDYSFYKSTVAMAPAMKVLKIYQWPIVGTVIKCLVRNYNENEVKQMMTSMYVDYYEAINGTLQKMRENTQESFLEEIIEKYVDFDHVIAPKGIALVKYTILTCMKIQKLLKKYNVNEMDAEKMWCNSSENLANQMNHEVMRMSIVMTRLMEKDDMREKVEFIIQKKDNEAVKALLDSFSRSEKEDEKQFCQLWNAFMLRFGRRGPAEFDIGSPRYENSPYLVLSMICHVDTTGYRTEEENEEEVKATTERILGMLSPGDLKKVNRLLPVARCLFAYRETPKYALTSCMSALRMAIVRVGEKMVKDGIIDEVDDVFYLELDEIRSYDKQMNSTYQDYRERIIDRKRDIHPGYKVNPPRAIIGPECSMKYVSKATQQELLTLPPNILKGTPTSGGVYEGVAVVATDPDSTIIRKGEILVAKATDPGWTPLFAPAGAVIIEIGGPLTHGSVIAREMAIPCVVGIVDLTSRVKSGMRIRVDGYKGIVELIE